MRLFRHIWALDVWVLVEVPLLVVVTHVRLVGGGGVRGYIVGILVVVLGSVSGRSHPRGTVERCDTSFQSVLIDPQRSKDGNGDRHQEERKEGPPGATGPVGGGVVVSLGNGRYDGHDN